LWIIVDIFGDFSGYPDNNILWVKIEGPEAGIPSIIKQTCC